MGDTVSSDNVVSMVSDVTSKDSPVDKVQLV